MPSNMRDAKSNLVLHFNACTTSVTKKGDLKGSGTIWYQSAGTVNILPLNNVKRQYRVTFGSKLEDSFVLHKENGLKHVLNLLRRGYTTQT